MLTSIDTGDTSSLETWLQSTLPDFSGTVSIHKFPGGQSNPTYRVDANGRSYALRRKPMGNLLRSAHAVDREYRVISALHDTGYPVPAPIGLCEDEAVIGSMFYVMEMVEGRTLWDGLLPDHNADQRQAVYHAMIKTLAQLHNLDPAEIGLSDFGRQGNYFERQVHRWTKQYRSSQTEDIPEMERLIDWLPKSLPEQTQLSVIHGDYRIDNMIFDPKEPKVAAVIDWELATLGDPLADFTYFAMNWISPVDGRSGLAGADLEASGIPTLQEAGALYCELTGRTELPDFSWYFAYNMFRLASIVQGIKKRVMNGNASNERTEATLARLVPCAQMGWQQALLAGA